MNNCQHHTFQILTKRAQILYKYYTLLDWTPNIWMGVTVENAQVMNRIDFLRKIPAYIKFLSLEPLLSSLPSMNLQGIDWIIVGGESGPKSRLIKKEWVLDVQRQCTEANIAFFFKQWGGRNKKITGKALGGKIFNQMPQPYSFSR